MGGVICQVTDARCEAPPEVPDPPGTKRWRRPGRHPLWFWGTAGLWCAHRNSRGWWDAVHVRALDGGPARMNFSPPFQREGESDEAYAERCRGREVAPPAQIPVVPCSP